VFYKQKEAQEAAKKTLAEAGGSVGEEQGTRAEKD